MNRLVTLNELASDTKASLLKGAEPLTEDDRRNFYEAVARYFIKDPIAKPKPERAE